MLTCTLTERGGIGKVAEEVRLEVGRTPLAYRGTYLTGELIINAQQQCAPRELA
jgi:hypothetical protein